MASTTYVYRFVCKPCDTKGKETDNPDRAERMADEHNRAKHGRLHPADVTSRRA